MTLPFSTRRPPIRASMMKAVLAVNPLSSPALQALTFVVHSNIYSSVTSVVTPFRISPHLTVLSLHPFLLKSLLYRAAAAFAMQCNNK